MDFSPVAVGWPLGCRWGGGGWRFSAFVTDYTALVWRFPSIQFDLNALGWMTGKTELIHSGGCMNTRRIFQWGLGLSLLLGATQVEGDCPGDLDGDCVVDGADLGQFFLAWGTDSPDADLDGDGIVDGADFGALLLSWGDCPDCPEPDFVHGNPEVLAGLHDGGATVLMIGDSISNWGSTNFTSLYHSAICTWKPVEWRGIHTSPEASGAQGHYVLAGTTGEPGEIPAFFTLATDLTGEFTATAEALVRPPGTPASSGILGATISHSIFRSTPSQRPTLYRIGRPFENAAGVVDFVNTPGEIEVGFSFLMNGEISDESRRYLRDMRARTYRNGEVEAVELDLVPEFQDGPGLSTARLFWESGGMDDSGFGDTTQVSVTGGTDAETSEVIVVQDFYFGRAGRPEGLALAYAGDGGWRMGNHLLPAGGKKTPVVGSERPGYTDEALAERIDSLGSTHYFIHVGANDFAPALTATPEDYLLQFDAVIDRLRTQHQAVSDVDPSFIVLGLYFTGVDDEKKIRPLKEEVRLALMLKAEESADLVYLDLAGYLATIFDLSNIDAANPFAEAWLVDQVHPNPTGAEAIGEWIWSRVEAAVAARD